MCSKFHMYADDLQIYTHCKRQDFGRAVNDLNTGIGRLLLETEKHGLKLNQVKTKLIIIVHRLSPECHLLLLMVQLYHIMTQSRALDLLLNRHLVGQMLWSRHITVFAAVHSIKRLKQLVYKIFSSLRLVFLYFYYCNSVINNMNGFGRKIAQFQN